jgi:hypothetical protein
MKHEPLIAPKEVDLADRGIALFCIVLSALGDEYSTVVSRCGFILADNIFTVVRL